MNAKSMTRSEIAAWEALARAAKRLREAQKKARRTKSRAKRGEMPHGR